MSSHPQPPTQTHPLPTSPTPLNVIALISGGKDSLYTILHCLRNGHNVIALANLHPAPTTTTTTTAATAATTKDRPENGAQHNNDSSNNNTDTLEEDIDSFMYQTIGHGIIPLYAEALGLPLYRQAIRGGAVDTARVYGDGDGDGRKAQVEGAGSEGGEDDEDETESLIPLLERIKRAHPTANAVCAGAILSTYQRTRIESVAGRLGLTPLAWLWQYPTLPRDGDAEAGLLEDMAGAGCEARIIKVASGGLDEGFLWGDVSGRDGRCRGRIVKGMRRFVEAGDLKGAVLGEGGEYESLALDGPGFLWKRRIEVPGREVRGADGGVAFVRLDGARCVDKEGDDGVRVEDVRRPALLDEGFEKALEGVVVRRDGELGTVEDTGEGLKPWGELQAQHTTNGGTWVIANITAPEAGPGAAEQMEAIAEEIKSILASTGQHGGRTTGDIVFTTVLLRSMADFLLMNGIYVSLFKKPNPPARATVACGESLPEGVKVMVSAVVDLGPRDQRQGLHVQSRSYWAPANIGPYSQAMSVPLPGGEQIVYIAGQIPLEPASMEVIGHSTEALTRPWVENYALRAVLSLQHLWRIGIAMQVDWWLGTVAFLTGDEHIEMQARIAWELWVRMHARQTQEEEDEEDTGLDAWDIKYGGRAHEQVTSAPTPQLPKFEVVQSDDALVPAFFAVQIEELPRGSDIEWQGLGYRCGGLTMAADETEYGRQTRVTTEQNLRYVGMEIDAGRAGSGLESCLQLALQSLPEQSESSHAVIYTSQPLSGASSLPAQIVPCKSVWGPGGRKLAAGAMAVSLSQEEEGSLPSKGLTSEAEAPDCPRQFSRSPHPYRRKGSHSSSLPGLHWPRTSSDSGTEADDESTGVLKGLPAPPLRPRKGLRAAHPRQLVAETDQWFPVLRPWPSITRSTSRSSRRSSGEEAEAKASGLREQARRKRRIEVLQRLLETALLLSVGAVVLVQKDARSVAWAWRKELLAHSLLVTGLYAAYPLHRDGRLRLSGLSSFVIPTSFEPAPLLYPILIPLYVSLSLAQHSPTLILPNILLSLSSLPTPVIPLGEWAHGCSIVHWMITVLPIVVAEHLSAGIAPAKSLSLLGLSSESLTLVFPLHQALIPTLDFLLTTSVLPAERQLLTSALINLFLFATSPQAEILKALLWLGGLCIFISCRDVLRWEVTLARIPGWKFRRSPGGSPRSIFNVLDHKLCQKLSRTGSSEDNLSDSDSPEGQFLLVSRKTMYESREKFKAGDATLSAETATVEVQRQPQVKHRRRHTISSVNEVERTGKIRTTPSGRRKRLMAPGMASFLSMTVPQAQVRKWLYAGYVYATVLLIIVGPVRKYIGERALQGADPFGWALGYLLGNVSWFRFWVLMWNLDHWIPLPARLDPDLSCSFGWVEHLRQDTFGEANSRLLLVAYCVVVLVTGLAVVLQLSAVAEVDTRRKVFHGMMVLMFLPTVYVDPPFCALALGLVLSIFLLLDLFRASQLPPISRPLTYFLAPYVDGRDHRGPVIVSHIFLLIGCSIPLWLSLADVPRTGDAPWAGWSAPTRDVSMVSGIICVGMGDAAASLVGRRFGRRKWFWGGGKSLEGSVAFAVAVTCGLLFARGWLVLGEWPMSGTGPGPGTEPTFPWLRVMLKALLAAGGTSATEAILTGCNDNVVVPVVLWLLVRGLGL
ncbi:hypothetical protein BO70DRAFT_386303 [Aspergillus heteromorphus CBS 117.55]|uniref:Diphthine--ammonia ligase n=1 Tax=Aspergillus heteromorphus CBS 117.55 TaxID=1448321 RepID=A0A317WHL3_9EURO|nr:uncharacterized protein BO70DRAFT_386303 [Aspergillus heteromorphus CBS 117.55]PWY85974.1 hypothetical protein BO70DRAFT_386303 [Aspergillus heteromorphus CBS 117.55]